MDQTAAGSDYRDGTGLLWLREVAARAAANHSIADGECNRHPQQQPK
jgi:hypothetical protein